MIIFVSDSKQRFNKLREKHDICINEQNSEMKRQGVGGYVGGLS